MEQLSEIEKEMIAGLGNHPAFVLLLRVLGEAVGALEEEVAKTANEKEALFAFNYWRAVKRVHGFLETQPARFAQELQEVLEERRAAMGGAEFDPIQLQQQLTNSRFPFAAPLEGEI